MILKKILEAAVRGCLFAMVLIVVLFASALHADAQVAKRAVITNTLGAATWTIPDDYVSLALNRLILRGVQPNDATGVVKRVTRAADGSITNTVFAALVVASGVAEITDTNATKGCKGDSFLFTGFGTNTGSKWLLELTQTP